MEIMAYHWTITKHMSKINQDWHAKLVPPDHKHKAKVVHRRLDYCEELNPAQMFREYRNTTHITFLAKVTNNLPDKRWEYSDQTDQHIQQNMHKVMSCFVLFSHILIPLDSLIPNPLTHWGRVTHICVSKLSIIGSDNGLSPDRRQAIIWTNAGILLIGT